MSTSWRAKVVRSITAIGVLCLLSLPVQSQDLKSIRVTYSCNATSLETVLDHLSKKTGANFVYSADKIKTNAPVSLSAKEKPLLEILVLLGSMLNLQFKIQGQYITIKPREQPIIKSNELVASRKTATTITETTSLPNDNITENVSIRKFYQPATPTTSDLLTSDYLKRKLPQLQSYFDATVLKQLPLAEIQKLNTNNTHLGWFMSGGVLINDYSKGFELQAGVRSVYAVFSPSWSPGGTFHGAFGLGTAFQLNRNFSLNSIYTYAKVSKSETIYKNGPDNRQHELYKVGTTVHHQQIKAMLQWAPGKNVTLNFGPTFNYSRSIYRYTFSQILTIVHVNSGYGEVPPANPTQFHRVIPLQRRIDSPSELNHVWLGWEASVSYKINFFKKP